MPNERTPGQIALRFDDERESIEKYVRFLHARTAIRDRQVQDLNGILHRVQVQPLPTRRYDRASEPYTVEELTTLVGALEPTGKEVYQTILGHEQRLDDIPSNLMNGPAAGYFDQLDEWVEFIMREMPEEPDDDEIEHLLQYTLQHAQEMDEEILPPEVAKHLIPAAMDHALHIKTRQRINAMEYALEQFEEIRLLANVAQPEATLNVLRQGFILLMTAFDAAVFDLVRMALKKNFFKLIGQFGKQEKVSLDAIAEGGSFEGFRDQIIEDQLKKRYVKDLLALLQALDVNCADEPKGDKFVHLVEMVLRRNIHVHNRGIVDERYLERDTNGAPRYNLHNLKLGEVAMIDESYWKAANARCAYCIDQIAKWASS